MCHQTRLGVNGYPVEMHGRYGTRGKGAKKRKKKRKKRRERSIKRAAGPCEVILTFLERLHLHGLFRVRGLCWNFSSLLLLPPVSRLAAIIFIMRFIPPVSTTRAHWNIYRSIGFYSCLISKTVNEGVDDANVTNFADHGTATLICNFRKRLLKCVITSVMLVLHLSRIN